MDNYTNLACRVAEIDERAKSNTHRIDDLETEIKSVHETQISLVKIANSVENMGNSMIKVEKKVDEISDKQDKLNDKVVTLENQPAKNTKEKIDNIIEKVIWVVIGGVIVGMLGRLFPGIPW